MATPAKKIAWLDQEDLRAMGVRMAAKPSTSMIVRTDDTTIQEVPGRIRIVSGRNAEAETPDKQSVVE
jgi:hypothetical protein